MSKRIKVRRPATANNSIREAVNLGYSDGDGYSIEEVLHYCRYKLFIQGDDVCYAPRCEIGVHGVLTFHEAEQAVFESQGLIETPPEAFNAPRFFVIVCPMVVHESGLLIPGKPGTIAASVFQAPFGWSRLSTAERTKYLQGRLPGFMLVPRKPFVSLFVEMAKSQRPQHLQPVFHHGDLEFLDSNHFASTLHETLTGPITKEG